MKCMTLKLVKVHKSILEKYSKIWSEGKDVIGKDFDDEPICN